MSSKRIGRPPTGPTKTKKSLTIDIDILSAAENAATEGKTSLSALVEAALERYLASVQIASSAPDITIMEGAKVHQFQAKAHLQAAAGSPIDAEVMDWDGADDTVSVRICGLSMVPLLNDGDIVAMRHKKTSRSPYMKKGLIYLVAYDGGYTVKRYNTRKPKPEEVGEEWIEKGRVKVLESVNPDFPEIIIKQPLEWVAWLDR